jgi:hypothetical protein
MEGTAPISQISWELLYIKGNLLRVEKEHLEKWRANALTLFTLSYTGSECEFGDGNAV